MEKADKPVKVKKPRKKKGDVPEPPVFKIVREPTMVTFP